MKNCAHIVQFSSDLASRPAEQMDSDISQLEERIEKICSLLIRLNHRRRRQYISKTENMSSGENSYSNSSSEETGSERLGHLRCKDCFHESAEPEVQYSDSHFSEESSSSSSLSSSILSNRLHLCAECFYVGCFSLMSGHASHMREHTRARNHCIIFDVVYGTVYCTHCRDFQYFQTVEDLVKKYYLREKCFPHGKKRENVF